MAGTNILTSTLDLVSQSLQIPVIIFLLLFAIGAIILLGGLIRNTLTGRQYPMWK